MARQVLTILNDLIFAELFAPGSRAEVPIVGRLVRDGRAGARVAGQVDRLAVTPRFGAHRRLQDRSGAAGRTGRGAASAIPRQLALYRAVLGRIYPEKTIRAALIFTEGPTVMELPRAILDASLAEALAR